jgi:hypothetical protein
MLGPTARRCSRPIVGQLSRNCYYYFARGLGHTLIRIHLGTYFYPDHSSHRGYTSVSSYGESLHPCVTSPKSLMTPYRDA